MRQSNDYPKNHGSKKYNRHNKYISANRGSIFKCFIPVFVIGISVGGVSATNPVANSSGCY